jgi:hypothetical protein
LVTPPHHAPLTGSGCPCFLRMEMGPGLAASATLDRRRISGQMTVVAAQAPVACAGGCLFPARTSLAR